jgi:hypothetical protein
MKLFSLLALSVVFTFSTSSVRADDTSTSSKPTKSDKKKKVIEIETRKVGVENPKTSSYGGASEVSVTASIGSVDGNFVYGPGFQQEWPVIIEGNRFAFGWQTGFYYTSTTQNIFGLGELKAKVWGIPVLASGKYLFDTTIDFLKPYIAVATGLGIDRSSGDVNVGGFVEKKSETNVHFVFFFRPGVTFGETQHWFAELPIGVMFTSFTIMPTFGYHF